MGAERAQPSLLQLATAASTSLGLASFHRRPYIVRTRSKEVVISSSKTERIEVRVSEGDYEQFLAELDRPVESVPALRELSSRPRGIQFGES